MSERHHDIGVVLRRKMLRSPWAESQWLPEAALPDVPAAEPGTALGTVDDDALIYAGAVTLTFHAAATAHYRDNLASGRPTLWVSLRPEEAACELAGVTADPYEAEALTEAIGGTVDAVPMPAAIQAELATFIAAFHVEQPFFKRRRDRLDPQTLRPQPAKLGEAAE